MHNKPTRLLLNIGHALDHMFLLIFATAVTSIAQDFQLQHWEDLMPYSVAAFFFFGLGSIPAGKLGDAWGRRPMMLVFFVGIGLASIAVAFTQTPLQLAFALALLGCMASIYHPVGIPMLVQGVPRPGWTIGVNGLAGNLGLAMAAAVTGLLMQYFGWRMAFVIPGVVSVLCGVAFAYWATPEAQAPARQPKVDAPHADFPVKKLLIIMTLASTTGGMLFNFSTNSNFELLTYKFAAIFQDPAQIGFCLALVYVLASFAQLVVGYCLDRMGLKPLFQTVIALQITALALALFSDGWWFYAAQLLFMAAIFGAVPFADAMIVRYVDNRMRSRIAGLRLAIALGVSSLAVGLIGPVVKATGFGTLIAVMLVTACLTFTVASFLPHAPAAVLPRARGGSNAANS